MALEEEHGTSKGPLGDSRILEGGHLLKNVLEWIPASVRDFNRADGDFSGAYKCSNGAPWYPWWFHDKQRLV